MHLGRRPADPGRGAMKKPEYFDAAKFPEAKFVSTHVVLKGLTATINAMFEA